MTSSLNLDDTARWIEQRALSRLPTHVRELVIAMKADTNSSVYEIFQDQTDVENFDIDSDEGG